MVAAWVARRRAASPGGGTSCAVRRSTLTFAMGTITDTSLTAEERALLERFAEILSERLGPALHAMWLFGSRARGELPSHEDSDVDVLVLVDDDSWDRRRKLVHRAFHDAAKELDLVRTGIWFSVHIHTLDWLAGRRAIGSFFIAEVDRDKVVIGGRV